VSTYDNGAIDTPDWTPERHPCPFDTCDVCDTNADQVSGYGTYPLPERFVLGEN
jgi:hypothetical protein